MLHEDDCRASRSPRTLSCVDVRNDEPGKFADALRLEAKDIAAGRVALGLPSNEPSENRTAIHELADEPWVTYTSSDRAGLALSGGGIRSASFTLGLLQALAERGVLPLFDYLSTVSGGGYTGGFWTSWLRANGSKQLFPTAGSGAASHEHPAIRHLREFSRFLAPRTGLGYIDLWEALLALLAGMVPTLVFATLLFATGVVVWRLIVDYVMWMALQPWVLPPIVFSTYVVLAALMENRWQRVRIVPPRPPDGSVVIGSALITASVLAGVTAFAVHPDSPVWFGDALAPNGPARLIRWRLETRYPVTGLDWIRGYLLPAGFAIGAAGVWAVRWLGPWWIGWKGLRSPDSAMRRRDDPAALGRALERASARLLFFSLVALAFAVIWHLSVFLGETLPGLIETNSKGVTGLLESIGITGGLTAIASAAFGGFRSMLQPSRTDDAAGVLARLRPMLPQLAAGATVILYLTTVTILCRAIDLSLQDSGSSAWLWLLAPAIVALLGGPDHRGTGLHEFYRRRISRAFVQFAGDECPPDCDRLTPCEPNLSRPVHLICCAANGVADDPLHTLYRGARSAVLSPHGLLMGNRCMPSDIRLSDALTASAAAFNSQMGGYSLRLGAAVSILMTALNLRLGLWLPTSRATTPLSIGGVRLLVEMFGATRSDQSWVHLSDGGHFDNSAAYELVRRHCRYIVVADCGADPKVRFDDISELIRRVREDFGVEIEIDVSPLRPDATGYSRQHVAAGSIFYGGRGTSDVGTLIVVKPTLTGDEPPDVTQYRARNSDFPHESTGDQFFDEPQWESYRRLGEHIGRAAFAYVEDMNDTQRKEGERVFSDCARQWHPLPVGFDDRLVALSSRCAAIESELRENMPASLRAEWIPELFSSTVAVGTPTPDDEAKTFLFLLEVAQVLEDAWLTCGLDAHGLHPLNDGWSAYVARWVGMPTFVRLWPLMRPMASPGFREFMKRRFDLRVRGEDEERKGEAALESVLELREVQGHAFESTVVEREVELRLAPPGKAGKAFEVGRAKIRIVDGTAKWSLEDLRVPARLHGGGLVGRFLDAVLAQCVKWKVERIEVDAVRAAAVSERADYNRMLDVYRGRGFRMDASGTTLTRGVTTTAVRAPISASSVSTSPSA